MSNIQISCLYYNENEFYGYYVYDKEGPMYEWDYGEGHYSDFVVEMLNHDYYHAAGASELVNFDFAEKRVEDEYGPCEEHYFKAINQVMSDHSYLMDTPEAFDISEYTRRVNIIKKDMESINLDAIKHLVDKVFIEENSDNLSTIQKYYAYVYSYKRSVPLEFISNISFNIERDAKWPIIGNGESQLGRVQSSMREKRLKKLKIDEEDTYIKLCKALSMDNTKCHSERSYKFNNFGDMLLFLLCEMINLSCTLKICPNCGRYFHPERSDAVYCNRPSPQNGHKTCQEYIKYQKYINKTRNDEATKLYKQIYNQKANKVRRTREGSPERKPNSALEKDLNQFKHNAEQWTKEVKAGTKTEAEYISWLKEVKEKKVL